MRKKFFRVFCFLLSITLAKSRPHIDDLFSTSSFIDTLAGGYNSNKESYGASDVGFKPYINTFNVPSYESGCYTPGCRGKYRKPIKSSTNAPQYTVPTSSFDYRPRPEPVQTSVSDYRPRHEPVQASAYDYRPQPAASFSYSSLNWCRKSCRGWNGICNKCPVVELYECPAGCYPS